MNVLKATIIYNILIYIYSLAWSLSAIASEPANCWTAVILKCTVY